jgi:hypothetical protein
MGCAHVLPPEELELELDEEDELEEEELEEEEDDDAAVELDELALVLEELALEEQLCPQIVLTSFTQIEFQEVWQQ